VLQSPTPNLPFEHRLGQIFADEHEGASEPIRSATLEKVSEALVD
jgi:hypothetical protein